MDQSKKMQYIIKSSDQLTKRLEMQERKVLDRRSKERLNYQEFIKLLQEDVDDMSLTFNKWENTPIPQIGNISPIQFYETFSSIDEYIDMAESYLSRESVKGLPDGFMEKVNTLDRSVIPKLKKMLGYVMPDQSNELNVRQNAIIMVAGILGDIEFLDELFRLIPFIMDHTILDVLLDAFTLMGVPALEKSFCLLENDEGYTEVAKVLLRVIANVGSSNRTEHIYRFLKDRFRKSNQKGEVATVLAAYGDGRVIPSIRGYVERNASQLSYQEYIAFRNSIEDLGGNTDDLKERFEDFENFNTEDIAREIGEWWK